MLTLVALTALLQATPAPLVPAEVPLPSLEAGAPSPSEPREVGQLTQFLGKHLLSWDLSTPSAAGAKIRQRERTFAITEDLSEPLRLVPPALALAQSAQRDYQTGVALLWIGGGASCAGLVMELAGLLLLTSPAGLAVAIVGVALALLGLVPVIVSARYASDAMTHFAEAVALYNRGLLELRPATAVSGDFSPPPLLRF